MSNETSRSILTVKPQDVGMAVGHVAALALISQMREGSSEELQLYYRLFEPIEDGQDWEHDLSMLTQYVCGRSENVSGEQLFRKASELALHSAPAASFFEQPIDVQIAYRLFAKACRLVSVDLEIEQREERSRLERAVITRKPIPLKDRAIEQEDDALAKEPLYDRAATAIREMPRAKVELGEATTHTETKAQPEDDTPLSIGERPVAHQGKPKRGGARVPSLPK